MTSFKTSVNSEMTCSDLFIHSVLDFIKDNKCIFLDEWLWF